MRSAGSTTRGSGVFVGCSGWHYADWRGRFYPDDLPQTWWLQHYAGVFNTVELNNTFYRLPSSSAVERWRWQTGESFTFAVKGSRFITHTKRLRDTRDAVALFIDRMAGLRARLGPVLWQLPPTLERNDRLLSAFLESLPHTPRHAIEFRHPSWWNTDVHDLLHAHRVAICLTDMEGDRSPAIATSDIVYVRFHGPAQRYASNYDTVSLARWAAELRNFVGRGCELYAYFNNDARAYAVQNALTLRQLLVMP